MSNDSKISTVASNLIEEAKNLKIEGNHYFTSKNYDAAEIAYSRGFKVIQSLSAYLQKINAHNGDKINTNQKQQLCEVMSIKIALMSNQVLVLNRLGRYDDSVTICTQALNEIHTELTIHENEKPSSNNRDEFWNSVETVLLTGQIKLMYRRALALESMSNLIDAEKDLQRCLSIIKNHDFLHQNNNQKFVHDTLVVLERIRKAKSSSQYVNGNRIHDTIMISNDAENKQDTNGDSVSMINCAEVNNDIGSSVIDIHNGNIPKSVETNNPLPEKQREIIMTLLRQSPREGEAFFLIHYDWWIKWCRYVNFFMDYEYLLLKEKEATKLHHQDLENQTLLQDIAVLVQKRKEILNLLPCGAVMPKIANENKREKIERKLSSCSSETMDRGESSSDEEDSDCQSLCNNRMNYGEHPGVINNADLQCLLPSTHLSKENIRSEGCPGRNYVEWNFLATEKKVCHDNFILRPRLVHGYHFELLPREVYAALRCWYGESTPSICRRVMKRKRKLQVMLYPELHKIQIPHNALPNKVTNFCGACKTKGARQRCSSCYSIYYCDQYCQNSHWPYHKSQCKSAGRKNLRQNPVEESPTSLSLDPFQDPKFGRVGLSNLGNTCFMNASLQCLSHAAPLTRYFLSNRYKVDLNLSNPLGAGGKLAIAYDAMIKELWMCRDKSAISPTALKRAIAIFAPRFSGMSQHDSQEFLAFLLDGLHEDLNKIKNPPYVEMPDVSEEQKLTIAGEESWDAHCLRNRSIVMDTFYGQFKSTCVCPLCNKVSVSFDVFNHVSLEIPQRRDDLIVPVLLFKSTLPLSEPRRYSILINVSAVVGDIKVQLSKMTGIPVQRLSLCEIFEHKIYEMCHDEKRVRSFHRDLILAAYEIDPYSDCTMHVISSQCKFKSLCNGAVQETDARKCGIGYPMITSFSVDLSCFQVWCHFRDRLHYIFPSSCNDDKKFGLFRLRIVDENGKPRSIFGTMTEASSILPKTEEKLVSFLEDDCVETFLFIEIEWNFSDDAITNIDEKNFTSFSNDSSVLDAVEKKRSPITLEDCFEQFTLPEHLDDDNRWYCSACKEHVRACKTMELWRLPNILIIHLKRFEFKHSLRRQKLETLISFPLEGLNMEKYCASTSNESNEHNFFVDADVPAVYDLFGVVNHMGRMGFGHYTACARRWNEDSMENDWVTFDDSSVRRINKDQVNSSSAYVLFYRRRVFI